MINQLSFKPRFSSFLPTQILVLIALFATTTESRAQSTCSTPTQISGFGVDGDLNANTPATVMGDSWFSSSAFPGTGVGVISSSALTASPAISASQFNSIIQSGLTQQDRNRTYLQRMAFPFLTNINGNTLIDAFAVRDNISPDTTSFTSSNKNGDSPSIWTLGPSTVPNKNDIVDAGGHLRRSGVNSNLWMFAYITKLGTSGDSYSDIEIYRQVPIFNPGTGSFSNTGPVSTGGHTAFTFSNNGLIVSPGDILVCINYNSTSGFASVRVWCNINNLDGNGNGIAWFNALPSRPFNFTGDFITGTGGNGYGYAEITSLSGASCLVHSVLNSTSSPAGYWGNLSGSSASYSANLNPEQMVNIAINFTDFGLDFATISGPCSNLFGALLFKTRTSSSFNSELKDFTGPYSFANYSEVQADAGSDKELTCTNTTVSLSGSSLTSGVTVTWNALSGNIVSGVNTFSPVVNQPGTYVMYVQSPLISTCIATDTVIVSSNFLIPNANAGIDETITCSSPSVTLNGSSSTPGATFSWAALPGGSIFGAGNTSNPIVGSGCYVLTTSNPSNGCTNTDTVCVNANTQVPTLVISSSSNASCYSSCNGSATANASGLNSPYIYEWSSGQTSQSISGLCFGTYSVTVTGSNGCSSTTSVNISQPSNPLVIAVSSTQNANCNGSSDGSISIAATGGTAPYSYLWSNGSTSNSSGPVAAGNYAVTVTDSNGCTTNTNSLIVSQPPSALSVVGTNISNATCFGSSTGSIDVSASGGTAPYAYLWSNGATTEDINGLPAGTYVLTVTDANGCTFVTSQSVGQPSLPLASNSFTTIPINCFGGNDGSATINASGGTSPYVYLWSNGQTTETTSGLSAGLYTVSVSDANGCTSVGIVQIVQPSELSATVNSIQNVGCISGSNGSINLVVSGGVAPYSYAWSNGSTTQDVSSLIAGAYTVTITDANGCTTSASQIITEPSAPLSLSASVNQSVSCFGGSNGSIAVSVSGGTPTYAYNWSNGATTPSINGLSAGNYSLTVTDANGCQNTAVFSISEPIATLSANLISSTNVSCNGGSNGNASVSVSGGTTPYVFLWSNGSSAQDLVSVGAGTYTLTVTDANGCTTLLNVSISQPISSLASVVSVSQNVSCNGGGDGVASVAVSGGTGPYTYLWNNGATTQAVTNLSAGNYTITVTDANGCTEVSLASISQPQQSISIQASVASNISCFNGNNGTISISIAGGTAPYSYLWSNGSTNQNLSQLPAGTYTVTVTDANGCTEQSVSTITQPPGSLAANVAVSQNVSCFGGSTGNLDLTVTGGTAPYSYLWSNGAVTEDISNLNSGTYTVSITDANGCNSSATGTINQPIAPIGITVSSTNNVDCFGGTNGSASVSVSGGTAPYSYLWNNGSSNNTIISIPSGTYTVTVTDANGCTSIQSLQISEPVQPLTSTVTVVSNVSCFGGADGSISAIVTGGTPTYSYSWSNGGSGSTASGLSAGNYTLTVTDANGCITSVSASVAQPTSALSLSSTQTTPVSCTGGSNGAIDLTVNGGTQPYNYSWSNGATSEDISGLSTGTYTVTVQDVNGCTSILSVNIGQPQNTLSLSTSSVANVDCFGGNNGNIDLNVAGGTSPYTYQWSNGSVSEDLTGVVAGTYTVSVVDANGCDGTATVTINQPLNPLANTVSVTQQVNCFNGNDGSVDLTVNGGTLPYTYSWSNGSNTEDLSGLAAGVYSVLITDQNGCQDSATVTISQPISALSLSSTQTIPVSCTGGSNGAIDLTVNGGTQPYNYSWSNGATSEDISGLSTGTYTVTVQDVNGCTSILSVNIGQPQNALSLSTSSVANVDCFGGNNGNIDLTVAGGTSPYTYQWSNGSVSEDLTGVVAGTYTVSVVDANGCDGTATVTVNQPSNPLANTVSVTQQVNCFNGNDGSVDLTVNGGTLPYTYSWSNGSNTEDLSGLAAGVYSVLITDQNGCQDSATVTISQPQDSIATSVTSSQQVSCFAGANGSIDISVVGGTSPYSYSWSNGSLNEDLSGLDAGTYTVTVTDANGCTSVLTTILAQPLDSLSIQTSSTQNVACFGDSTGTIDLNVTGGTAPYQYNWSNGFVTEDLSNIQAGSYTVTVTDSNGCTSTQSIQLSQPSAQLSVSGSTTVADCLNNSGGDITISPSGGTVPYAYQWSNGSTTQNLNNLPSATYTVTITDANGCTTVTDFVVANNSFLLVQITNDEICVGDSAVLSVSVPIPATYQWYYNSSPIAGAINNFFVTYAQGFYKCEVNSVCGIVMSDSVEISVRSLSGASISSNQIICPPETVELIASGGTTYQWSPAIYINDPNSSNPTVYPRETTVYSVLVTDDFGCKTTMSVEVAVVCDTLLIPNGYSPNGDGVNDGYVIEGIENYPGNILYIYNRWGNLIYKARDYQNNWTGECNVSGIYYGKKVPAGTYYYILDLNDGQKPRNGFIILRK